MIKREKYLNKINSSFNTVPIVVLIGARQVGKTSLMKSCEFDQKSLFLNGQDPEIAALFLQLSTIEAYLKVYLNDQLNGYILLDEFQFIHGIATQLKLLTDKHPNLKILCSGSSSLDILQKVEESLAGRVRTIEVLSLSFEEYLLFKNAQLHQLYVSLGLNTTSSALTTTLENELSQYLLYGGLPRAALTSNQEEKREILTDIYKTYLLKDVRSYVQNQDFIGFNKLLRILSAQNANLINLNEISRETGLSYRKCEEYLNLIEQMYIIKLIEPFHSNKRKVIGKMKKVFFCDLGLRNINEENFSDVNLRTDHGALFENYVLLELWRNKKAGRNIQFYRTKDGAEVDFVLRQLDYSFAIKCKYKNMERPTQFKILKNFCNDENIQQAFCINRNLTTVFNEIHFFQGIFAGKLDNPNYQNLN